MVDRKFYRVAHHEAGHAVASAVLGHGVSSLHIVPESIAGVRVGFSGRVQRDFYRMTREYPREELIVALAGPAAECVYLREDPSAFLDSLDERLYDDADPSADFVKARESAACVAAVLRSRVREYNAVDVVVRRCWRHLVRYFGRRDVTRRMSLLAREIATSRLDDGSAYPSNDIVTWARVTDMLARFPRISVRGRKVSHDALREKHELRQIVAWYGWTVEPDTLLSILLGERRPGLRQQFASLGAER